MLDSPVEPPSLSNRFIKSVNCCCSITCKWGLSSSNKYNTDSAMPRNRRIPLPGGNATDPYVIDLSESDDPFLMRHFNRNGQKGVGVYVRSAYFSNLDVWDKHVLGKIIRRIIRRHTYGTHLKFIFFDSTEDESTQSQMSEWLDTVWELTLEHGGQENIYLFTLCDHCDNLATIKFTMSRLPEYICKYHACKSCCYGRYPGQPNVSLQRRLALQSTPSDNIHRRLSV